MISLHEPTPCPPAPEPCVRASLVSQQLDSPCLSAIRRELCSDTPPCCRCRQLGSLVFRSDELHACLGSGGRELETPRLGHADTATVCDNNADPIAPRCHLDRPHTLGGAASIDEHGRIEQPAVGVGTTTTKQSVRVRPADATDPADPVM